LLSRKDLTLGYCENFPSQIHKVENFGSTISSKQLQQKLIQVIYEINRKEFCFDEITNPTIPNCNVIFEFGLADNEGFTYIEETEKNKFIDFLIKENLDFVDFFCGIRYYKVKEDRKQPLKFDYYLLRTIYKKANFEINVHHERGPRYVSPQDLIQLIFTKINDNSGKKVLKQKPE
jgi:hypothetical protein